MWAKAQEKTDLSCKSYKPFCCPPLAFFTDFFNPKQPLMMCTLLNSAVAGVSKRVQDYHSPVLSKVFDYTCELIIWPSHENRCFHSLRRVDSHLLSSAASVLPVPGFSFALNQDPEPSKRRGGQSDKWDSGCQIVPVMFRLVEFWRLRSGLRCFLQTRLTLIRVMNTVGIPRPAPLFSLYQNSAGHCQDVPRHPINASRTSFSFPVLVVRIYVCIIVDTPRNQMFGHAHQLQRPS